MGINIADNFQYLSQKPLDGRTKYDTTAAMKAVSDSSMYDGCLAYCSGTDKTYQWKSSNSVDATLGRWREFATGGTDNNAYHTNDAAETSVVDDDYFPFYDTSASTKKKSTWTNLKSVLKTYFDTLYNKYTLPTATSSVLGGVKIGENMLIEDGVINPSYLVVANKFNKSDLYSTTEKVVGCWTDGRPIYQKVVTGTIPTTKTTNYISVGASVRDFVRMEMMEIASSGNVYQFQRMINGGFNGTVRISCYNNSASSNQNKIGIEQVTDNTAAAGATVYLTIRYTKTSDAANSFNYADENDYSTSEKIVGTWTNGANLYQRTYTGTLPSNFCSTDYSSIGTYDVSFNSSYTVRAIEGGIHTNTYDVMLNDSWGISPDISFLRVLRDTAKLQFQGNRTAFNSASYYLTVKYTK